MKYVGMTVILVIIVCVSIIYNILAKARNKAKELYKKIDDNLRKRWDLIPGLVEAVKNYSIYEDTILEKLTSLIKQDYDKFQIEKRLEIDNNVAKVVSKMMEIAEDYPELQADEQYMEICKQLAKLDTEITDSKKEYNETVQKYNSKVEMIPTNFIAILFGFNEEVLLVDTKENPQITE